MSRRPLERDGIGRGRGAYASHVQPSAAARSPDAPTTATRTPGSGPPLETCKPRKPVGIRPSRPCPDRSAGRCRGRSAPLASGAASAARADPACRMPARSPGGAPVGLVASQPRHDLQVRITCRSSYLSGNRAMRYAWALTVCCTDCCDGWVAASRPRSASTSRETGKDAQEPNRSQGYSHNRVRRRSGPGAGRRRPLGSDDLRSPLFLLMDGRGDADRPAVGRHPPDVRLRASRP